MTKFYCAYLLVDVATETHRYTGVTEDLQVRLAKHNAGEVPHTSKIKLFHQRGKLMFEVCLKTYSGRSFANRHF